MAAQEALADRETVMAASKRGATPFAFDLAHRALRAAEIQLQRIWSRPVVAGTPSVVVDAMQDVLVDVHFYFVALRNIHRFLFKVVKDPAFTHLQPEFDALNQKWLTHYSKGREAFEHIDQRLPGEKFEHVLVELEDGGARRKVHYGLSLRRGVFRHSDQEWDITQPRFEEIRAEVLKLLQRIVDDARSRSSTDVR